MHYTQLTWSIVGVISLMKQASFHEFISAAYGGIFLQGKQFYVWTFDIFIGCSRYFHETPYASIPYGIGGYILHPVFMRIIWDPGICT